MNTSSLRSKRLWIPSVLVVLALAVAGIVWASTASADLEGQERDRVSKAATQAVGGGKVVSAESSDDDDRTGEAYEVEVRKSDGTEVDVTLDKDLKVLTRDGDDNDGDDSRNDADDVNDTDDDANDPTGTPDADDRVLSASEKASAEKAALAAVGGGTVVKAEASDDRGPQGEAYEVDVRKKDNTEWNVDLDADFKVLRKAVDN